jgi:predicted nucleic acid-binding protein
VFVVDTNVLVYVYDHGGGKKREIARRLITDQAGALVV